MYSTIEHTVAAGPAHPPRHRRRVARRWPGCAATPARSSSPPCSRSPRCGWGPLAGRRRPWPGPRSCLVVWARLHPPSFDRWAAPWLRRLLAPLDGLPRPPLDRRARGLRPGAGQPPHRPTRGAPGAAGPLRHALDRHPVRADGPRPGPAHLDREGRRPRRRAVRAPGRRSPRSAPPCSPWWSSGRCRSTTSSPHPDIPGDPARGRPLGAGCRGRRARQPVPTSACWASTCSSPEPPAPGRDRCCGPRCARSDR